MLEDGFFMVPNRQGMLLGRPHDHRNNNLTWVTSFSPEIYFDHRLGKGETIFYGYHIMRMVAEVDRVDFCQCHAPIYDHR